MKRIVYSLLLVIAMSCGSSKSQVEEAAITVHFRNSGTERFYLFSVRDSSVLVNSVDSVLDFTNVRQIRYSDIDSVTRPKSGSSGTVKIAATNGVHPAGVDDTQGSHVIFLSTIISPSSSSSDKNSFDLRKAEDRVLLKRSSLFPEREPPQLQNIK